MSGRLFPGNFFEDNRSSKKKAKRHNGCTRFDSFSFLPSLVLQGFQRCSFLFSSSRDVIGQGNTRSRCWWITLPGVYATSYLSSPPVCAVAVVKMIHRRRIAHPILFFKYSKYRVPTLIYREHLPRVRRRAAASLLPRYRPPENRPRRLTLKTPPRLVAMLDY